MFRGILRHLYGAYAALLFLVILSAHHCCSARNNNNYCSPSSCGNIQNISYPFRLKTDPKSCGHINYELVCENNRPTLYLKKVKYYVQAIDYSDFTIRLVDAAVQKDDCFSIPHRSLIQDMDYFPYNTGNRFGMLRNNSELTFISCANRILNPPDYIVDASSCKNGSSSTAYNSTSSSVSSPSSHSLEGYSYVMVDAKIPQIPVLCRINLLYYAPGYLLPENMTNMSYRDVHDILLYGFELSWLSACCDSVKENRCNYFNEAIMGTYCEENPGLSVGDEIKSRTASLPNLIVSYLVLPISKHVLPISRHIPDYFWTGYDIDGKLLLQFSFYNEDSYDKIWTISSDLLGIPMLLFITLLALSMIYRALLFICGLPCLVTLLIYKWRRRHLSMYDKIEEFLQSHDHNLMPVRYSYSEIKKITNGFKEKLGKGGFGSVYKGKLRSGRFAAIKILDKSKANGQDFMNEIATIGRIHHVNVVQLIGFTVEGSKRALIYEFMSNGSLEKYIFSRHGSIPLSNKKIYEISLGVARGIEYLHQGCDMQILHFDIKPHNILLDEKFVPKVSDFGLAKLYPTENSIVSLTAARGTMGYMAPELFCKNIGGVSYKADVYSFGMLLMEMVGRRKNLNALADHSSQIYFPSWVYDQVSEGKDIDLGDHAIEKEKQTTKKIIIVALWCIQLKPNDRPSMHEVVRMLQGDVESLQMPPKPFLTSQHIGTNDDKANPISLSNPPNDCIDSSYQFGR